MTTDQFLIGLMGIITTLVGAYALQIKANARRTEISAENSRLDREREKDETTTDSYVTKAITDEVVKGRSENSDLQRALRECEVEKATDKGTIKELRKMVVDLGERNATQASMMRDLAMSDERKNKFIETLETKIKTLELQLLYKQDNNHSLDNFLDGDA